MTKEEALNKVRQMSLPKETMDILEALAPELTMSEDEMMIYELQGFLISFGSDYFGNGEWQKFDDWLEKQKKLFESGKGLYYYNGSPFDHTYDIYPIARHFYNLGINAGKV